MSPLNTRSSLKRLTPNGNNNALKLCTCKQPSLSSSPHPSCSATSSL